MHRGRLPGDAAGAVRERTPEVGVDPHDKTAFAIPAVGQFTTFLNLDGKFVNTCGATPCYALGWTGP
jgi:hypothetical protein